MPTAAEVQKLVDLFAPALSAADRGKLAATVAGLDWGRKQPLPQRRFGLAPTAPADSDPLRQRLAALAAAVGSSGCGSGCSVGSKGSEAAGPPQWVHPDYTAAAAVSGSSSGLRRELLFQTPSLRHWAFATAAGVAGYLTVWGGDRFGWSPPGGQRLEWTDPSGHRLAQAATTAAEPAAAYRELLEWLGLHLEAARCSGEPLSEPEQRAAVEAIQTAQTT